MPTSLPIKGESDKKIGAFNAPLAVSAQDAPNMTVKIRAGSFFNSANVLTEFAGGNSPQITPPASAAKWVVVGLTDAGSVTLVHGVNQAAPSLPAIPAGTLALAAVYVTSTTTSLTAASVQDIRPFLRTVDVVADVAEELANRPTFNDVANDLALKADVDGTTEAVFTLNKDNTSGSPGADATLAVARGVAPAVAIRWNESVDQWEFTNDGINYGAIASTSGTYAPLVHYHVHTDITDFDPSVNALIAAATIDQAQVSGLSAALSSKANQTAFAAHAADTSIHHTLPLAQSDITNLVADLASKASVAGAAFTNTVTVQNAGNQPISLVSVDSGSSGLQVERPSPLPNAKLEWDESAQAWMVGTVGAMNTILTQTAAAPVQSVNGQIGNVVLDAADVGAAATVHTHTASQITDFNAAVAAAVPVQSVNGETGTVVLNAADVGAAATVHTHTSASITDFNTAAAAAAPVQSVNGMTGAVSLTYADTGSAPTVHTHTSASITDFNAAVNTVVDSNATVAAKLDDVVTSGTGTSLINSVATGTATLKSITATNAVSLTDNGSGTLTVDVPIAGASTLGAIKVGSGLSIAGDGTLSASGGGGGSVTLTGDVTGNGTGTVPTTLSTTGVAAGTYTKVTVDTKGRVTTGANLAGSDVNTALGYTAYDGATNPSGFLTGNQTITVSGDASGSGTNAITLALANSGVSSGTYKSVTVDAKGRVTAGSNPTTLAGFGITDGLSNTGGSITGDLTFSGGFTVKGLPLPGVNGDAANKLYVDNAIAGVATGTAWKANAEVATTADIVLSGTQTIDGYAAQVGDRVLVKDQTDPIQNGVYVVAAGAWTRATDVDTGTEIKGMAILVLNGTASGLSQWINTNTTTPTVGSDPITFAMLQGAGTTYTAGTGLTLAGNQFSITNTGVTGGTYTKVTVNSQGQVTTGTDLNATDVNTALGYTAYNGTTNPNGFLTGNQAVTLSGDATGTGTTAITVALANTGVAAGTYSKVTVDAKGRVTTGANINASDVTTALTFTPVNKAGDTLTGALNNATTVSIAAAATTDIGTAASNAITVTGNTAITALGTAPAGAERTVVFTGTPTLTHNATSLILPTSANIVVAAGDAAVFRSLGGGNWRCIDFSRADGSSLVGAPDATKLPLAGGTMSGAVNYAPFATVASAATTDIGAAASNNVTVTGSTTITSLGTIAAGAVRTVTFAGVLTLTHNATSLILPTGSSITTQASDVAEFVSLGGGNWRCTYYTKAVFTPASTTGVETLTNKTLSNATITNFTESGVAPAAGASHTVDLTNGTDVEVTTNANFTVTLPAPAAGKSFTLTVNYGGAHTLSFTGGTIRWQNGTVPTATSVNGKADVYVFKSNRGGTAWFGSDGGRNF